MIHLFIQYHIQIQHHIYLSESSKDLIENYYRIILFVIHSYKFSEIIYFFAMKYLINRIFSFFDKNIFHIFLLISHLEIKLFFSNHRSLLPPRKKSSPKDLSTDDDEHSGSSTSNKSAKSSKPKVDPKE